MEERKVGKKVGKKDICGAGELASGKQGLEFLGEFNCELIGSIVKTVLPIFFWLDILVKAIS